MFLCFHVVSFIILNVYLSEHYLDHCLLPAHYSQSTKPFSCETGVFQIELTQIDSLFKNCLNFMASKFQISLSPCVKKLPDVAIVCVDATINI